MVAALLLGARPARAQAPDTGYSNRAMQRLAGKLNADPALPDSLRHLTVPDLLGPSNTNYVYWLDDSSTSLYMHTTAATLYQVPEAMCGGLLQLSQGAPTDLDAMLPYADSGTIDRWVVILERVVRARSRAHRDGRVATDSEVRAAMSSIPMGLDAADRDRLIGIARHPPPSQTDACWSMLVIMDGLAALPVAELGPVVRAMFGGERPAGLR